MGRNISKPDSLFPTDLFAFGNSGREKNQLILVHMILRLNGVGIRTLLGIKESAPQTSMRLDIIEDEPHMLS